VVLYPGKLEPERASVVWELLEQGQEDNPLKDGLVLLTLSVFFAED
jgi:hypothetical protein